MNNDKVKKVCKNAIPDWNFIRKFRVIDMKRMRSGFMGCHLPFDSYKDFDDLEEAKKYVNGVIDNEFQPKTEKNKKDRIYRLGDFFVQEMICPCNAEDSSINYSRMIY